MSTKHIGNMGEEQAAAYLRTKGYQIRAAQFRSPMGEIDLIAEKENTLVFVEVKTRHPTCYGTPAQVVSYTKRRRIVQTAYWYMQQKHVPEGFCRFDVIEVYCGGSSGAKIQHFENAFEV